MKHKYLFILLFTYSFFPLQAQLFVGVKLGMYRSSYVATYNNSSANFNFEPHLGGSIGINTNLKLSKVFSIQPEINVSNRGGYVSASMLSTDSYAVSYKETRRTSLNYLEVPLLLRIAVGKQKFRFFAVLGPHVSYMINGKDSHSKTAILWGGNTEIDAYSNYAGSQKRLNRSDFGAVLGLGASFKVGEGYLSLDARWTGGYIPVNKTSIGFNMYNVGTALSVAYIFKVIHKKEE